MTTAREWRCFHCDEVFTDVDAARLHFGVDQDYEPGCVARVPDEERVLLAKIHEQDAELERFYQEDSDKDREMHALRAEHSQALIREEEKGYERALRDVGYIRPPVVMVARDLGLPLVPCHACNHAFACETYGCRWNR